MAFVEDLSPFFDLDDFGISVVVGGNALVGVLDKGYEEASETEGLNPELHVRTADLPGGLAHGATVTIGAASYTVRGIRPDESTLVTILDLEYVSG